MSLNVDLCLKCMANAKMSKLRFEIFPASESFQGTKNLEIHPLDIVRHIGGQEHQSGPPPVGPQLDPDDVIVPRQATWEEI